MVNHQMRRGFTLVELSIVLVIIGLLIGGVLAAQSMIKTTKVLSFVKQIQQYDVAVGNFKTQFNSLPGDSAVMSPPGDGDGIIGNNIANSCAGGTDPNPDQDDCFSGEIANFWVHLSTLKYLSDGITYSSNATNGIRAGVNVPKGALGHNSGIIVTNAHEGFAGAGGNDYADWPGYNFYHIYDQSSSTNNSLQPGFEVGLTSSISAAGSLAVDLKIDDGVANTGVVRAVGPDEHSFSDINAAADGSGCVQNADHSKYQVGSTSSYPCSLAILLLSQVGQAPGQ